VDGRSIMGVLTLAATRGSEIEVAAKGKQAEEAIRAVEKLVDKKFFESE
jgi:phosphocarrier protein HPr